MYRKILVPVDGSDAANRGLAEAVKLAKTLNATIGLVHVVNEFILDASYEPGIRGDSLVEAMRERGRTAMEAAEALVRTQNLQPETRLLEAVGGRAAEAIVQHAKEWSADLIVMGTHGRRGMRRMLLGSDAEAVLRASSIPILLVRTPDESAA